MNLKNKYLVNTLRTVLALFLILSGVSGLVFDMTALPEPQLSTTKVFLDTGIFHLAKITEIVSGLMLLVNFLPALAALFVAPLVVGVLVFNASFSPEMLPIAVVFALLNAYMGYVHWDKYKAIFRR